MLKENGAGKYPQNVWATLLITRLLAAQVLDLIRE
jgi:hypothetical protein